MTLRALRALGPGGLTLGLLLALSAVGAVLASFASTLPEFDPERTRLLDALLPPFSVPRTAGENPCFAGVYLLGTDALGRDVFLRAIQGIGVALVVGPVTVLLSSTIGVLLGAIAGWYGRHIDALISGAADVFLCFPVLFLYLAAGSAIAGVASGASPGFWTIVLVVAATSWMKTTRLVRAEILALRTRDFVVIADLQGASGWLIIARHLLPNAFTPVLVSATIGVAQVILLESTLSFLGVGPPSAKLASLGNIISDGRGYLTLAPWLVAVPGAAISAIVLSLNAISDRFQARLDPRSAAETIG